MLEPLVNTLTTQVKCLDDRCEDLEARSRRNNIRMLGVPEKLEGHEKNIKRGTHPGPLSYSYTSSMSGPDSTSRISVYPDYTSSVVKRRAAFGTVKCNLRSYPDVKFGFLYLATFKTTMPWDIVQV